LLQNPIPVRNFLNFFLFRLFWHIPFLVYEIVALNLVDPV